MAETDAVAPPPVAPPQKIPESEKHFLTVFFFSFMWGAVGVDRFYLGKIGTGLLKLLTFGGFGVWVIVDLAIIMTGGMRDKQGRPLKDFELYKSLVAKTVLIFAVVLGVVLLVSGVLFIYGLYELVNQLMDANGGQFPSLDGSSLSGDLDQLNNL